MAGIRAPNIELNSTGSCFMNMAAIRATETIWVWVCPTHQLIRASHPIVPMIHQSVALKCMAFVDHFCHSNCPRKAQERYQLRQLSETELLNVVPLLKCRLYLTERCSVCTHCTAKFLTFTFRTTDFHVKFMIGGEIFSIWLYIIGLERQRDDGPRCCEIILSK